MIKLSLVTFYLKPYLVSFLIIFGFGWSVSEFPLHVQVPFLSFAVDVDIIGTFCDTSIEPEKQNWNQQSWIGWIKLQVRIFLKINFSEKNPDIWD